MGINIVVDGLIFEIQKRGGISTVFYEIIPRICEQDHAVNFQLFTTGQEYQELPQHPQIRIVKFPSLRKYIRPQRVLQPLTSLIYENLIRHRFSQLYSPIWHSTYYTFSPQWHGPSIVTVHDMIYEKYPDYFDRCGYSQFVRQKRDCILSADCVICDSISTMLDVMSLLSINPDRCHVIPLACSNIFRVQDNSEVGLVDKSDLPFVLYVGRRVHYKNFRTLLIAYSKWTLRHQVGLLVAGHEPFTVEEQRWLYELKIQDRVRMKLNPDDAQLCELYNCATALVFPSLYEGFGIPLLEAMNCGCPIVASQIPSTLEVARDVPIYFEPTNEIQLISALDQVITEGKSSQRVSRGFDVATEYTWDITARKTLEVYRSLV